MPLTNRTHKALLDSMFGQSSAFGALANAPTIFVGLSSTAPNPDGSNVTEPSGGTVNDYGRVETDAQDWNAASDANPSVLTNAQPIAFPQLVTAGEAWGNVTHFVLFDAAIAGNVIAWGELDVAKSPTEGDTPQFPAASLRVELAPA